MEIYNYMAKIVRILLDRKFDADKAFAVSTTDEERIMENVRMLLEKGSSLKLLENQILNMESIPLIVLLQILDRTAVEKLENQLWGKIGFDNVFTIENGLNDLQNIKETNVMILPRYNCMWDGASRDKNHSININTFLNNAFFVEVSDAKLQGKYSITNYIMNPSYFGICYDSKNELYLRLAISPLTNNIKLDIERFTEKEDGASVNYFMVNEMEQDVQDNLIGNIQKVIRKSDENGDKILVFPEMLGTHRMKDKIAESITRQSLNSLQFIVFPSIWQKNGRHENYNISYILDYEGNEWFGQHKLRKFPLKEEDGNFLEDIIEGEQIHIIHCEGYGSVAVAICRSELDQGTREMLMKELNVKLILCPSWTTGNHEFECSILTGGERNCNVAWCNTCSALVKKDENIETVGIITSFGKSREYSSINLDECRFPDTICRRNCEEGCLFSKKIYGTNYSEGQVDDDEWEDGCKIENGRTKYRAGNSENIDGNSSLQ